MNESLVPILLENEEFGNVRWLKVENEPYAVGNDIASALEYAKPKDAVSAHCQGAVTYSLLSNGGMQETKIIPIGDIFRLIVAASKQSKNENIREKAKRLESWIFDTVIPAIATTGTYSIQPVQQIMVDPYKMNAEQQFRLEFLREQNRSKELDYKVEKVALEKMKFEAKSKKISEQSTVKNPAVQSFSWNEPLKVEKTHHSSDWVNITELINEQLKPNFPDVKKSRKLGANSLNDFLVENDYAERDFSELWSDGHYEDYTTIRFKEKGQKLIQKGIVTYAKSSLKKMKIMCFIEPFAQNGTK